METKKLLQSKTVWFNVAIAIIGGIAGISAPDIADLGLSAVASAWILKSCGIIGFVGNIYLRTITSTPITK